MEAAANSVGSMNFFMSVQQNTLTPQTVTFNFNDVFHTCANTDSTSFCNQLMCDNSINFSQICGNDLTCDVEVNRLLEIADATYPPTLYGMQLHEDCPDIGLGVCLLHAILDGKSGPFCDNLPEGVIIDDCESRFAVLSAEDFAEFYEDNNMNCFCSRDEVQKELSKYRADVIIFDTVVASSHLATPSRRALKKFHWKNFWKEVGVETAHILGELAVHAAIELGRRNMVAETSIHFDWSNIVEVCRNNSPFDMCEQPVELTVKQFEFLCMGEPSCEVSLSDVIKVLLNNYTGQYAETNMREDFEVEAPEIHAAFEADSALHLDALVINVLALVGIISTIVVAFRSCSNQTYSKLQQSYDQ